MNHMIRFTPVRVVGPQNEQIGVIETPDAIRMAEEQGLDLVEIQPDARPPVCKIMDYGKHKYELSKRQTNSKQASNEVKEIRLGRSVKIGVNDVKIRVDQARRFLMAGHKVVITQRFRGREMAHKELGIERLADIAEQLSDIAKVEMAPRWAGRQASILMSPEKQKVESARARMTNEQRLKEEAELAELEAKHAAELAADDAVVDDDDDDADKKGGKKGKGPADDRAVNPVDDEIANLLGE